MHLSTETDHRCIRFPGQQSFAQVLESPAKSNSNGRRCLSPTMAKIRSVPTSPVAVNSNGASEIQAGQGQAGSSGDLQLAHSTLVATSDDANETLTCLPSALPPQIPSRVYVILNWYKKEDLTTTWQPTSQIRSAWQQHARMT
ncbi:hypothetical protein [Absidia glauca]|uniref:Uncharacterized protein n=1 Tax=Absidia glauca TaxID=4829 RepID=A0A168LJ66_ABSGL|nr:hypothetical protein [Absidia glauca]